MTMNDVLTRLVRSCRRAKTIMIEEEATNARTSPKEYGGAEAIYGDLLDAIYLILDEDAPVVEESLAYTVVNSRMSDEDCSHVLTTVMNAKRHETMMKAGGTP